MERVYRPYRADAVQAMRLKPGDTVLDLACGTGPNLEHLVAAVGARGTVFAVDFSQGMLARARRRVDRAGWSNVHCLQRDARGLTVPDLEAACGGPVQLDAVLTTLGLSVIPDWQGVLTATWSLLRPHGRLVVFDVHAQTRVPMSFVVALVAQADLGRRPWVVLAQLGADVEHRVLRGSPHVHGGRPFLVVATRPA